MKIRGGEFSTGTTGNFQPELTVKSHFMKASPNNPRQSLAIRSVQELVNASYSQYFTEPRGRWIFRGHSDEAFQLVPSECRGGSVRPVCLCYVRAA